MSQQGMTATGAVSGSHLQAVTGSQAVFVWAALGLIACAFSFVTFGQWLVSAEAFQPVPLTDADAMSAGSILTLRALEVVSTAVALWALYFYLLKPWVATGRASIEGLLLIGALVSYVLDTSINLFDYLMAWNKHAINFGTWASFFPGHTGPTQYAEALLWGPPMYIYFGVALGTIQLFVFDRLRNASGWLVAFALSFAVAFVADLVAESLIIRMEAYAWPYTLGALTLWAGTQFQFPLYESLLVAIYSSGYMALMISARSNTYSFIERGVERAPARLHLPLRLLAATGFATLLTGLYFAGYLCFSIWADTRIELPPYLMFVDPPAP